MRIVKGILVFFWLFFVPFAIGQNFAAAEERRGSAARKAWIFGYIFFFALFQMVAIPVTFLRLPFTVAVWVYGILSVSFAFLGIVRNRKSRKRWFVFHKPTLYGYLAVLLILLQTGISVLGQHTDADDSFFVATANTTVYSNRIFQIDAYTGEAYTAFPARYVLAPYQIWIAFISKVVQMHPAAVAHTVLPAALIPLAYAVFSLCGETLLGTDRKKNDSFLLVIAVILMSSYYSVYTKGTFLLVRIWQGKAVLAAILLPAVFLLCMRLMVLKKEKNGWIMLFLAMLASLMVSSMGILLPVLTVAVFALFYGLMQRNLQILFRSILVCMPNFVFAVLYLVLKG